MVRAVAGGDLATRVHKVRVNEQYILSQVHYNAQSEGFSDWKNRIEAGDSLYQGRLDDLFPEETALPRIPYVENKYRNALHDIKRLSTDSQGLVKFIAQGERDRDMKQARIRESINEGYWGFNDMKAQEGQFYLDLAGTGIMACCAYYDQRSPYPQFHRLNPRFGYPDVRNNKLQSYLNTEVVKERVLAREYPDLGLDDDPANTQEALFVSYYDDTEVAECVLWATQGGAPEQGKIVSRWVHDLGVVPVAFEMLDTYEGGMHGLFEQLSGPLMVRNKVVRFLVDYIEQTAHSPIIERGVENPEAEPGPMTIYHLDPNIEGAQMTRLQAAAAGQGIWNLLSYMGDQEEREAIQPPSRSGNVSQSIASGSFVDRTQGQLTSLVKEMQDKMASFRVQLNRAAMMIDEDYLDDSKPLWRPVSGKTEYMPSKDIGGWYFHEVKFGAGAGLDRINTHQLVQSDLAARLISREEARAEIDYLDDSASSQDKIDRENLQDVIFQRMAQDPSTPISSLGQVWIEMKTNGASLDEALEKFMPQIVAAEAAAQPQQPGIPAVPGEAPPEAEPGVPGPTGAEQELAAMQAQAPDLGAITQRPPLSLVQVRP